MADAHAGRAELLDGAAGLVDRAAHVGVFADLDLVDLEERARVDRDDRAVDFVGDAEDAARVGQVRHDDLGAVERQARALGVGAEFGLRHVGRSAGRGDDFHELAGFHGVAVAAADVQDGYAREGRVRVEGDLTLAERTEGGVVADGQLGGSGAAAGVDPDVAQGIGTDVVRAAEDDGGRTGAAADDQAVRQVGAADRAGDGRAGGPGHDLGVAIGGDVTGDDFAAVEAEGADAALAGRGVAGEVQAERRRAAVGLRVAVAPTRDGEVVGVRAALHPDLGAVLDDHVGRAEGVAVRDDDALRVRGRDARGGRLEDVGAGEAGVVAGEGHGTGARRAGNVGVDADRAGAGDVRGQGQVGVRAGDLQRRAGGHVYRGVGGQDRGAAQFERAGSQVGAAGVRVDAGQDQVARAGLVEADEAEAGRAVGEDAGVGGLDRVHEVRDAGGVRQRVRKGRRVRALGNLGEVLAEAVEVDQGGAMDAQLDFGVRQERVALAETKGAFAHVEERVARARAGRIEDDDALADRRLRAARDQVAGQGQVARGDGARVVDGGEVIAAGVDTSVERDATGDGRLVGGRGQHDDARAGDVAGRVAIEDQVVRDGDAVAELEAGAAVRVGTGLRRQRDGAARQTEGIQHLHVAFVDDEVARDGMVDERAQDEAAVAGLRHVGGAADGGRRGVGTRGADVEGDVAGHRDGGARGDRSVRVDGQGGAGLEGKVAGEAREVHAAAQGEGRARLDGDDARGRGTGEDLGRTEDGQRALGDREVTFGDGRPVDADGVRPGLGQGEARQVQVEAEAVQVPALRAADGGVTGQGHGLQRVGLGEVRVVDDRAEVADARAGDGHRTAGEADVVGDRGTGEVQGGAGRDRDRGARRTEGGIAVDAERTAIDAGRARVGVRGGEDEEAVAALGEVGGRGSDARQGQGVAADVDGGEAEGAAEGDDLGAGNGQRTGARDRSGQRDVAVVVEVEDRAGAQGDEAGVVDDRGRERGVVAQRDAGRAERARAGDGDRAALEGEGARGAEARGAEAASRLREAGGGEVAGERGRARVGEGAGGGEVGRAERTGAEGGGAGADRACGSEGPRRGERAARGEGTDGQRASRSDGASDGEGLARLRGEDAVGAHGQSNRRGRRRVQQAAVHGGRAQGKRGGAGHIERCAIGDGRGGGDGEGVRCGQGAGRDGDVREADRAGEGRGAGVVLEEVARATDVIDDGAVGLLDDEHRARIEGQGPGAERAAVDELQAAARDVGAARVGVRQVDRQDARAGLVDARIERDVGEGDGRDGRGQGVGGDVDRDERVRRGVDELQVVEGRGRVDFGRQRPGADGALPTGGVERELVGQEARARGGVVLQEGPAVGEVRVEDRGGAAAGEGFVEREELHGHRRRAEREDGIHNEAVALGQAARVGGFKLDDGARGEVEGVEADGAEAAARAEDTARGDIDRAGRGRACAAIGRARGHVDRARAQRARVLEDRARVDVHRADRGGGRTRVGERARGEDGLRDGAGTGHRAAEEAQVRQGTGAGRRAARDGQTTGHGAGVSHGAGFEQGVGRDRPRVGEGAAGDLEGLAEADLGDVGARVVGERAGVDGDVAAEAAGVGDGRAIDDRGGVDRARVQEGRASKGVDRAAGGDDAGRGSLEGTRGDRGRARVGVGAAKDPAARTRLEDRRRPRVVADDEADGVVAGVRTREGERAGAGLGRVGVGGAHAAEAHGAGADEL